MRSDKTLHQEEEDGSEIGIDDDDEPKSLMKSITHRIVTNFRLPYYVFVSADAILDMTLSVQAILEESADDDDLNIKGWALFLFTGTIFARLLGGVFYVVYHRIIRASCTLLLNPSCTSLMFLPYSRERKGKIVSSESTLFLNQIKLLNGIE